MGILRPCSRNCLNTTVSRGNKAFFAWKSMEDGGLDEPEYSLIV